MKGEEIIDDFRIQHKLELISYGKTSYIYHGKSGEGISVAIEIISKNFIESGRYRTIADSASRIVLSVVEDKENFQTLHVEFVYQEHESDIKSRYNVLYRIEGDELIEFHHGTSFWP